MAEYFPSQTDSLRVKRFKRAGVTNDKIAEILRISLQDLEKHYPFEINHTDAEDLALVADVAYKMATSGEDPGMTKWWLTVKGGWIYDDKASREPLQAPMVILLDRGVEDEPDGFVIDGEVVENDPQLPKSSIDQF